MPLLLNSEVTVMSLQWDKVAEYMSIWSLFSKEKDVINTFTGVLKASNLMDQRLKRWVSWSVFSVLALWWRGWSIHGITQYLGLTGTSGVYRESYPVYSSCSGRAISSQLLKTLSRQLFSIFKDGDSSVHLGNLCQDSITFPGKRCFLMFRGREPFVFSASAHCLWFYHWVPLKGAWLCLPCTLSSGIFIYW